jgi:hypothetical protein
MKQINSLHANYKQIGQLDAYFREGLGGSAGIDCLSILKRTMKPTCLDLHRQQ